MKIRIMVIMIGVLFFAGCGTTQLTNQGMNVRLMRGDPPLECKQILELYVEENDLAGAKNELRNEAAKQGANYVRLDALEYYRGDAVASGSSYKCD